ncbi:helix-turn-helix domain-containing protein [Parapedobacter deserti]|uniref:Helix-turn-helix domain-containing protein n=1 Tax=Parapedobacter deserti TaxID=1912957 RepID=A0ABV7JL28_9SPHI
MSVLFHIDFPFQVAETHYRFGDHAPLCAHPIPFANTVVYHHPQPAAFTGTRQYYGNSLLTIDLLETQSAKPLLLSTQPVRQPLYVLSIVLEGHFHFGSSIPSNWAASAPGTAYLARIGGQRYTIRVPAHVGRLISITIHTAQLAVIGEDFAELTALLAGNPKSDDYYCPSVQADSLFMRRLIKLTSPSSINRRKDFNQHLQTHLQGVFSAFKGLLYGKGQVHYDEEKLKEIKPHIASVISETHQAPEPKEIADQFHITPKKLERLFKNGTQLAPSAYIKQVHMEAAGTYLTDHPDLPIYEIADIFGYNHTAAFSKAFTKHHGLSPQAYRVALQLSKTDTNC